MGSVLTVSPGSNPILVLLLLKGLVVLRLLHHRWLLHRRRRLWKLRPVSCLVELMLNVQAFGLLLLLKL